MSRPAPSVIGWDDESVYCQVFLQRYKNDNSSMRLYSRFNVCIRLIRTCGIVSKVDVERHRTACLRASLKHWCPAIRLLKWRVDLSVVLRLLFQWYPASVDAAQTRGYPSGFEPSANINLALSHRQNIDMFHVQTYLPMGSDTIRGSCTTMGHVP